MSSGLASRGMKAGEVPGGGSGLGIVDMMKLWLSRTRRLEM